MDSFIAAHAVGPGGHVIGIDMTPEMIDLASSVALSLGLQNAEFRAGLIEDLPLESDWADVVISNGVINLCPDKLGVYKEIFRVLKPGERMTIADICVEKPVPRERSEGYRPLDGLNCRCPAVCRMGDGDSGGGLGRDRTRESDRHVRRGRR